MADPLQTPLATLIDQMVARLGGTPPPPTATRLDGGPLAPATHPCRTEVVGTYPPPTPVQAAFIAALVDRVAERNPDAAHAAFGLCARYKALWTNALLPTPDGALLSVHDWWVYTWCRLVSDTTREGTYVPPARRESGAPGWVRVEDGWSYRP